MPNANNFFKDNCLVLIDETGKIFAVPRIQGEKNHS